MYPSEYRSGYRIAAINFIGRGRFGYCRSKFRVVIPLYGPRSPDLSPLDIFFWDALKAIVYETPVDPDMDLMAQIIIAALQSAKCPVSFKMFGNSCGEDIKRASMPLGEILSKSCHSRHYYCTVFLGNKALNTAYCIAPLLCR
ncbi:hypothetical protein AVEN_264531-1 [Araneus ventricosus]|uniref:Uncharacterized protein n=1 Tax=Araneus ventricosus TaxID=182803 RepID=A0A4Y2G712_ARAVE|nr:hypothetical protein AVEN_264531-1 [Araneus ventricosus]